jgi:hypothetical protein
MKYSGLWVDYTKFSVSLNNYFIGSGLPAGGYAYVRLNRIAAPYPNRFDARRGIKIYAREASEARSDRSNRDDKK